MIKDALEFMFSRGKNDIFQREFHGLTYTNRHLDPILPPHLHKPEAIHIRSLAGLVDYIDSERYGELEGVPLILYVVDHATVRLVSALYPDNFNSRFAYAQATADIDRYEFGKWNTQDDFILSLLSLFVQTEATNSLRKMISKISLDSKVEVEDNGASQRVSYKSGIAIMDSMKIESPIMLQPYSTFLEVDQPEIGCVCRVGKDGPEGKVPYVKLTVADGGMWKLTAMARVKKWLKDKTDIPVI